MEELKKTDTASGISASQRGTSLLGRLKTPSALKYPEFRRFLLGQFASVTGLQMLMGFSLGWLIFQETGEDARYIGYTTACIAAPGAVMGIFGGVVADKFSSQRIIGVTQFLTALLVVALAVLVLTDRVEPWHVLLLAFLMSVFQTFDIPLRVAVYPLLVEKNAIANSVTLVELAWTGMRVIAPAIAGIIVGRASIEAAIFVSAGGFVVLSLLAQTLKVPRIKRPQGSVFKEMATGFSFIKGEPLYLSITLLIYLTAFFGFSYLFLMPVFAKEVLDVGAEKIGWLLGAAGFGALSGVLVFGNFGRLRVNGKILLSGLLMFGMLLITFSITSERQLYELSMVVLFFAEFCLAFFSMSALTAVQTLVPNDYRGRVMGVMTIAWSMVFMGALEASLVAHYWSAPAAVAIGGGVLVALALITAVGNRHIRTLGAATKSAQ